VISRDTGRTVARRVEAYNDLFFSVLNRKDDLPYLKTILGHGRNDSLFIDVSSLATDEENFLRARFLWLKEEDPPDTPKPSHDEGWVAWSALQDRLFCPEIC
jgi:hypothetical protein